MHRLKNELQFFSLKTSIKKAEINTISIKLVYDHFTLEPSNFLSIESLNISYIFKASPVTITRDDMPARNGVEDKKLSSNSEQFVPHKKLEPLNAPDKI